MIWRMVILIAMMLGLSPWALAAVDSHAPLIAAPTLLETVVEASETPLAIRNLMRTVDFKSVADPFMRRRVAVRPPSYWTAERAASTISVHRIASPTRSFTAVGNPHLVYYANQPAFRLTISL